MQTLLILLAGFSTALLQLLFFREVLSIFNGIDLVIGFVVSNTIFSFTLGIYTLFHFKLVKNEIKYVFSSTFLLILFSLTSFIFLQNIRFIFNIPLGSEISLKNTFISIFFTLFPISFLQGSLLFSITKLCCLIQTTSTKNKFCNQSSQDTFDNSTNSKLIDNNKKSQNVEPIIKDKNYLIYFFSYSFSFIVASLLYSYLFYTFIGTRILIIAFISLITITFIISKSKTMISLVLLSTCILFSLFLSNLPEKIDKQILNKNFSNTEIGSYHHTPYGQIVLTQKNNEYHFLINNSLLFSLPDNNIIESEDFVHISMLHHQNPKNILIIGKILKCLPIILKYNIDTIDYATDNKKIIENIKPQITNLDIMLNDKRLHIYSQNTKHFVAHNKNKYDLVFIAFDTPTNLYINSFYSKEFFEIAKYSLKKDGFLALQLPGKMVFHSYVTTELNQSIIEALKANFKEVRIVPGTKNIILASQTPMPYRMFIKRHLKKVQDKTLVLTKHHIDERMDTEKTKWLTAELKKLNYRSITNTICTPYAMIFSVLYEQAKFSPYLSVILDKISQYSYFIIFGIIIIFFLSKSIYKTSSFTCMSTSCWLNFIIIFILQSYNGQTYKLVGLFLSLFILGAVFGTFLAKNTLKSVLTKRKILFTEVLFLIIISTLFIFLKTSKENSWLLYIFLFFSGFALGIELLLLIEISKIHQNIKKILLSGAFGAFVTFTLGGSFLILVWGIQNSILFILFFKFLIFCRWADLTKYKII